MEDLFRSYWWLLFPLAFFVFGAWDRWLAYKRHKAKLDLMREYTLQGREPPAELLRVIVHDDDLEDDEFGYGRRSRLRRLRRHSPYWAWRTAFITGAVALGFWFASQYADWPAIEKPFRLVAIIMGFVALGHVAAAAFATVVRNK